MQNSSQLVYRKTAQGLAEIKSRSGGISARARSVLIMVNGFDSLETLQKKMGMELLALLQELEQQGYIEAPGAKQPTVGAATSTQQTPVFSELLISTVPPSAVPPQVPTPATPALDMAARLTQLRHMAVSLLAPYFGPDVHQMTAALLRARDLKTYRAELATLESRLAIYTGRKQAVAVLASLQPRSDKR